MGFLSRRLIPRGIRRVAHPVRAIRRELTPRPIKQIRRATSPVSNAIYGVERKIFTKRKNSNSGTSKPIHTHDGCSIEHRTSDAAQKCRKGSNQNYYSGQSESPTEPNEFETTCPKCNAYVNVLMDQCRECSATIDWNIQHTQCGGMFTRIAKNNSFHLKCSTCGLYL